MIYSLILLLSGIYLGQEYAIIPSVRIVFINMLLYLQMLRDPNEQEVITYYERIKRYFGL